MCLIAATVWNSALIWSIFCVAAGLGFVIFVHELGHFLVAKMCGVKCEKFYVGFDIPMKIGPVALPSRFCRFQWGETEYGIGILPLGGYVKMLGQDDDPRNAQAEAERIRISKSSSEETDEQPTSPEDPADEASSPDSGEKEEFELDPRSFPAKTVFQRMMIISAGVIMNLIFAVVFASIAFQAGVPYIPCEIGTLVPGGPAWIAGIEPESKIIQIGRNGRRSEHLRFTWDLRNNGVGLAQDKEELQLLLRTPSGEEEWVSLRPVMKKFRKGSAPMIGIAPANTLTIRTIVNSTAADQASPPLNVGDKIVSIQGISLDNAYQLDQILSSTANEPVTLVVERVMGEGKDKKTESIESVVQPNRIRRIGLMMDFGPITAIRPGSPAEAAGFQVGDQLLSVGGQPIVDPMSLPSLVLPYQGQPVSVEVMRDGEIVDLKVTPASPVNLEWEISTGFPMVSQALGVAFSISEQVKNVVADSPAQRAGLLPGDAITGLRFEWEDSEKSKADLPLKGKVIKLKDEGKDWLFVFNYLQNLMEDARLFVVYQRGAEENEVEVAPVAVEEFNPNRGIYLHTQEDIYTASSLSEAIVLGFGKTKEDMFFVLRFLRKLVTLQVSPKNLGGPVSIAAVAGSEASQGLPRLLIFLTLLSANLAVLNFMPIPALDGGHMLFLTWEWVVGKPVDERAQLALTLAGVACLLGLMIFVFGLDIDRWFIS